MLLVVVGLVLFLSCTSLPSGPAVADPLDTPRAQGLVGERYDGLAVVKDPGAPGDIHNLVAGINAKRQALYEQRAAGEGISAGAVGRVYAQEIFESLPGGTWFLTESGNWVQK